MTQSKKVWNWLKSLFRKREEPRKFFSGTSVMDFCVFLRDEVKCWPMSAEGKAKPMSNSEIIRSIKKGSVEINGNCPKNFKEPVEWPITQMVVFPDGKRKTSLI